MWRQTLIELRVKWRRLPKLRLKSRARGQKLIFLYTIICKKRSTNLNDTRLFKVPFFKKYLDESNWHIQVNYKFLTIVLKYRKTNLLLESFKII